jgi:hypothetical protein
MDFHLLDVILSAGNFFALTPPSTKRHTHTFTHKIYKVLVFAVLTSGVAISIVNRNFYRNFLHIKATVTLLLDLVLYAFNAYTMIVFNFWKRHSWDNLFGKLSASNFAQIKSGTNFKYFLAAHLVHLSIASYTVFVACQKDCLEFFKQYNVEFVQGYLLFLYKCLLFAVAQMVLTRYKDLNKSVSDQMRQRSRPTGRVLLLQIKKVEHSFCLLRKTVAVFNDMFGWPFALIISHTSLELLDIIDSTIYPERDIDFALLITGNLLRVSWNFVSWGHFRARLF